MSGYAWTRTAVPTVMTTLVNAVATALAGTALGAPQRVVTAPGVDVAWDTACGQLSLIRRRGYRSRNFPQDASGVYTKCDDWVMAYDMQMQLLRCVATEDANAQPPKPALVDLDLQHQEEDAYVVWTTVDCQLRTMQDQVTVASYIINDQVMVGPQGGVAGSQLNFVIGLYPPCPCQG